MNSYFRNVKSLYKGPSMALLLIFCMPAIMQGFAHTAAGSVLTGIYAKNTALSLSGIGIVILLCKIFDAISDPLIGYFSDKLYQRGIGRKVWITFGSFIAGISLFYLFNPSENISYTAFLVLFLLAYLGWTITEIPYKAWSLNLTKDYSGRSMVAVALLIAGILGAILLFSIPIVGEYLGFFESKEFTLETMSLYGWMVLFLLPLTACLPVLFVKEEKIAPTAAYPETSFRDLPRIILRNKPYMYGLGAFLLSGLASGMSGGIVFIYFDVYLKVGQYLPVLLILGLPVTIIATPFWGLACGRYTKQGVWAFGCLFSGIASLAYFFVFPFAGVEWIAGVLVCLNLVASAAGAVAFPSLMGDIADHGKNLFCREVSGIYYSIFTLLQKIVGGVGAAISLLLIDMFGFDAKGSELTENGILGLKLAYSVIPGILLLSSIPLLLKFPLKKPGSEIKS